MDITYDQSTIEAFREAIYAYARANPTAVDLADIQSRIRAPGAAPVPEEEDGPQKSTTKIADWTLKRLLHAAAVPGDVQSAMDMFREVFAFRREYRLGSMDLGSVCPAEFFRIGSVVTVGQDAAGRRVLYIRLKYYQSGVPQLDTVIKHFLVWSLEQQDLDFERGLHRGLMLVVDFTDFSYWNLNLDMMNFLISLGLTFHPLGRRTLFYELNWAFKYLFKMVQGIVYAKLGVTTNEKLFFMATAADVTEYVPADQLPDFINNGPLAVDREPPKGALPFREMVARSPIFKEKLEESSVVKIDEYLKALLPKKVLEEEEEEVEEN